MQRIVTIFHSNDDDEQNMQSSFYTCGNFPKRFVFPKQNQTIYPQSKSRNTKPNIRKTRQILDNSMNFTLTRSPVLDNDIEIYLSC